MARPKEFDVEAALERAMNLFWERGYEATSMSDLVEHLGVSRQSLYDTFGDKRAIYLAALQRRCDQLAELARQLLEDEAPIRGVLRKMFEAFIEQDVENRLARGCMMVNAAIEKACSDEEVRRVVCNNIRRFEERLGARLRKAQERGEIGEHHDPVALARFFASVLSGLHTIWKSTRDPRTLEDILRVALGVLG
jgi:TetR/AcrR family transcriptional regulator, transcriptional repressor for nem operon